MDKKQNQRVVEDDSTACYVDDDDIQPAKSVSANGKIEIANEDSMRMLSHKTDTSSYDSFEFDIVTPEQANKEHEAQMKKVANPEFEFVVSSLESRAKRKLTAEEYDKVCMKYAAILCERDEEAKNKYQENIQINPKIRDIYYRLLKENKPVSSITEVTMRAYEKTMIAPIEELLTAHQSQLPETIEVKSGRPINIRHGGKVRIAEDHDGKVIVIDNKKDVSLLHMQQRKAWLDKKFGDQINKGIVADRPGEDEFE